MTLTLTEVDPLTRCDHFHLAHSDKCFYLREYLTREHDPSKKVWELCETNELVTNFKKGMDRKGLPDWKYKGRAEKKAASEFIAALGSDLKNVAFVPVPPSKAPGDPMYDARVVRLCQAIAVACGGNAVELVHRTQSATAQHQSSEKRSIEALVNAYAFRQHPALSHCDAFAVVDDVLTTGAHFKAMQRVLEANGISGTAIVGLFWARRRPFDPFEAMNGL